jgi:hypothetical protein
MGYTSCIERKRWFINVITMYIAKVTIGPRIYTYS